MDHLVCFLPATMALDPRIARGLEDIRKGTHKRGYFPDRTSRSYPTGGDFGLDAAWLAIKLTDTCAAMYSSDSGLGPEIIHASQSASSWDLHIKPLDAHSLLRPETVEALFVMYRTTRDERYRLIRWEIFQSIMTHARIPSGGFSSVHSVSEVPVRHSDKMETFFLVRDLQSELLPTSFFFYRGSLGIDFFFSPNSHLRPTFPCNIQGGDP
jgi:mannosyl-oligosaccharide alpha-1,2-mannosidase